MNGSTKSQACATETHTSILYSFDSPTLSNLSGLGGNHQDCRGLDVDCGGFKTQLGKVLDERRLRLVAGTAAAADLLLRFDAAGMLSVGLTVALRRREFLTLTPPASSINLESMSWAWVSMSSPVSAKSLMGLPGVLCQVV